jgi:hypothetical protein
MDESSASFRACHAALRLRPRLRRPVIRPLIDVHDVGGLKAAQRRISKRIVTLLGLSL